MKAGHSIQTRSVAPHMNKSVDAYLSIQSPYCYFAVPRLKRLAEIPAVSVQFKPVMPGVLRIADAFTDRDTMEQDYFILDVQRTAQFLGIPYKEADPYPVAFKPGSLWIAEPDQPRVWRLLDLLMAASFLGSGLELYDRLMRLIWDGNTRNWHLGDHIAQAVSDAGLELAELDNLIDAQKDHFRADLLTNNKALLDAGHWGVPCCVFEGEPFYGQDRLDQLAWRMGVVL